jgi:hypothetical protein
MESPPLQSPTKTKSKGQAKKEVTKDAPKGKPKAKKAAKAAAASPPPPSPPASPPKARTKSKVREPAKAAAAVPSSASPLLRQAPVLAAGAGVECDLVDRYVLPRDIKMALLDKVRSIAKGSRSALRNGKVFKDLRFVLTSLSGDGMDEQVAPNVEAVIAAGGGAVVDSVTSSTPVNPKLLPKRAADGGDLPNTLLVAPRAVRTGKFFWALASHVPCVHYNWVLFSAAHGAVLPIGDYLLPATASGKTSPLLRLPALSTKHRALEGLRIELHSLSGDFRRTWESVVRAAGGRVVNRLLASSDDEPRIDVVVTDPTPTQLVVDAATKLKVPLVFVDWVVDSLIAGQPLSFGHD